MVNKGTTNLQDKAPRSHLQEQVENYRRAIKYLDTCGELTLEKLRTARSIAGAGPDDAWFENMWVKSVNILPDVVCPGHPGGRETLRYDWKQEMVKAIATFEQLIGPSVRKKFWQFWK